MIKKGPPALSLNLATGDSYSIAEHPLLCELYFKLKNKTMLGSKRYQDVYLSIEVHKYNERLGLYLPRVFVVTDETLTILRRNNFTNKELVMKRRITHEDLKGISKNLQNKEEAIIHIDRSYDLKIRSEM